MAKQHVSAAVRGLPAHPAVFLAVTPEIRRALELLAEASIALLDEIDAPVDNLEWDSDFEILNEDDEANGDHERNLGWSTDGCVFGPDDEREPDLGWTNDGDTTGEDADEDLAGAETSGGLPPRVTHDFAEITAARAIFDPRLAARPALEVREWEDNGTGPRFSFGPSRRSSIPAFPHEQAGRPAFHVEMEIRRLNRALLPLVAKKRKAARRTK